MERNFKKTLTTMNKSYTISGGTLLINCLYGKRLLTIKRALLSVDVCEFVCVYVRVYVNVSVCVYVRVHVCVCMCACVCERERERARERVCVCVMSCERYVSGVHFLC